MEKNESGEKKLAYGGKRLFQEDEVIPPEEKQRDKKVNRDQKVNKDQNVNRNKESSERRETVVHQTTVASDITTNSKNKGKRFRILIVSPILLLCSIVLLVIVLNLINNDTQGDNMENPKAFYVEPTTELFIMDTNLFGISFEELKKQVGDSDLKEPANWTYWGKDLKYTSLRNGVMCYFQNNKLVLSSYDLNKANTFLGIYTAAKNNFGKDSTSRRKKNGYDSRSWEFNSYTYSYYMSYYLDTDPEEYHFRQEYVSDQYVE